MRLPVAAVLLTGAFVGLTGCNSKPKEVAGPAKPKFGINPYGTSGRRPDYSKVPPDIKKVFDYIDTHIDDHVENLQKWIQQPSISNSGEGIPESAEMVKGFFDKLGCQTTRVYDVGTTEYGSQANPVVYAKCDEGAPKTVAIYWQYDTMPVTQPELWVAPPFEGRIVDGKTAGLPNTPRVMVGRGAANSKGGEMAELNALMAYKAVMGKLPVNIIWVAEGDEERMDIGLRQFMSQHSDLFKEADVLFGGGPSEGCVYVELTTSGKSWGRGPVESDVHGVMKRTTDSPAWRHMHMLAQLTSPDGNTPLIKGFFEGKEEPTAEEKAQMKAQAANMDLARMARSSGVARFMSDDPYQVLYDGRFGTSFNLDGIWGGNMYAGGAGAILPNKITSKHNFRYVPKMNGLDIVKKLRAQLDANGYKDVEMKLIGDVPWSRGNAAKEGDETDLTLTRTMVASWMGAGFGGGRRGAGGGQQGGDPDARPPANGGRPAPGAPPAQLPPDAAPTGGYWPSYLFADGEVGQKIGSVSIPMGISAGGGGGGGGRAHAANEYYTVEAAGPQGGMASAEKGIVASIYAYSQIHHDPVKPKSSAGK